MRCFMEKSKKIPLYGNIIFGVLILAATICFMQIDGGLTVKYITKSTASGLFVLCGVFNLICLHNYYKGSWKSWLLLLGLVFAMAGDIVLIEHFTEGAILFAIGHIFYLTYFFTLYKFTFLDAIFTGLIITFSMLVIFLYKGFEWNGMKMLVIIYATVISFMLGKAMGNYFAHKNVANLISFLGALFFFFSDMMLLFFNFAGRNMLFDYFCVYTYFPAEFMLAISLLLHKDHYNKRI